MLDIITLVSESHRKLLYEDRMLPSLEPYLNKTIKLKTKFCEQICPTGTFDTYGFRETMAEKLKFVIETMKSNIENGIPYLVYSDCDVQYFGDISKDIVSQLENSGMDILFQHDGSEFCAGFFIAKNKPECVLLFEIAFSIINNFRDDQPALNYIHRNKSQYKSVFDSNNLCNPLIGILDGKYWTYGVEHGLWNGGIDFSIKKDILVHHANWTVGIDNKIKLMDIVKSKVNELRNRG